jgi:hypothetical protein
MGPCVRRDDSYTGSAIEYFTWLSAKLGSIEAIPSKRVSLFFGIVARMSEATSGKERGTQRATSLPGTFFAGVSPPVSAITETETTRSTMASTSLRSHWPSDNLVSRSFSRMV